MINRICIILIINFLYSVNLYSKNCEIKKNIKIGILEYEFINYFQYIYYELDNFSSKNEIFFEIESIKKEFENYDIVFGEYVDINQYANKELEYPDEVLDFYKSNGIKITKNLIPLDLDTFILISNHENQNYNIFLDDLININDSTKYTWGMSFKDSKRFINLINFNLSYQKEKLNHPKIDYILNLYSKLYFKANNNLINSSLYELIESNNNDENIFNVFSDGILMNKDVSYSSFQLFPHTKFFWNENEGIFKRSIENNKKPFSFYGLSALINNKEAFSFICHLLDMNIRLNTFENFNNEISPISDNEIPNNVKNISEEYLDILKNKNKNIIDVNEKDIEDLKVLLDLIKNNKTYGLEVNNYLN